jgi:hypothetical protein
MLQAPPSDLAFLADLLARYPVRLVYRGQVLPEGPVRGEKLLEEGGLALYWEGQRPPSRAGRCGRPWPSSWAPSGRFWP